MDKTLWVVTHDTDTGGHRLVTLDEVDAMKYYARMEDERKKNLHLYSFRLLDLVEDALQDIFNHPELAEDYKVY